MAGNSFGDLFRITTFGESHGITMGVVIDGLPSGLFITEKEIYEELELRKPGGIFASKRKELDIPKIISGLFNGRTTGAPLTILIKNNDINSTYYEENRYFPRPGHSDLPAILKYGFENWDYRGSGRFSARETVSRVAAGAIAKKILLIKGILIAGCVNQIGNKKFEEINFWNCLKSRKRKLRTTSEKYETEASSIINKITYENDSIGGCVTVIIRNTPPGLGEPVFDKLKSSLAQAMMSIPGSTFFEIGEGILQSRSLGSEVNDSIIYENKKYKWKNNYSGGIIGGLSTGDEIFFKVGFKPTSSIGKIHETIDIRTGENIYLKIKGRHDPIIVPRAVPVVEAMAAIVILDHMMKMGEFRKPLTDEDNMKINEWKEKYMLNKSEKK
ncbi:MAG: chorismate synthase [Thermoplasmata archaeon]